MNRDYSFPVLVCFFPPSFYTPNSTNQPRLQRVVSFVTAREFLFLSLFTFFIFLLMFSMKKKNLLGIQNRHQTLKIKSHSC